MKVKTKTHTKVNLTWDTRHGNSSVALIQYAKYRATKKHKQSGKHAKKL